MSTNFPNCVLQFIENYNIFLNSNQRNTYVCDDDNIIRVYMRKGKHLINGCYRDCLDIANISVDEDYRSQGIGAQIIQYLHQHNPFEYTYVESVLNDRLYQHLITQQWVLIEKSEPPCFYKMK